MTQISFQFKNVRLVARSLEGLRAEMPRIARGRIFDALKVVVNRFKRYPAKTAKQNYIRTFRLRRKWKISRKGRMGYTVANNASFKGKAYARFVVGDAKGKNQAWMHQGRWKIFRFEMENALEKLPKAAATNVHFYLRRRGWQAG